MHGGIDWGRGFQWEWSNAIDLCAGTTNAGVTIGCFQQQVAQGQGWQAAIAACKFKPCQDAVQGKIAWDRQGSKTWSPANVERLCRNSTSDQPAQCFQRVMYGGIDWGRGLQWQWSNAIDLCAGTANAAVTIRCFQDQIGQGQAWQAAIATCKSAA